MKTVVLNFFRRLLLTNPIAEYFLKLLSKGYGPESWRIRLLPGHSLYSNPTLRSVHNISTHFTYNLAELMEWSAFYEIADPSAERFKTLIKPGDVVIDIGANIGSMMLVAASAAGKNGLVIGFEPNRDRFEKCKQRLSINGVENAEVHNLALGASEHFVAMASPDPRNLGMLRILANAKSEEEKTFCIDLESWANKRKLPSIDVIKIDVEGYEYNVLSGFRSVVVECRPILFIEVDDENLKVHGSSASAIRDLLHSWNYSIDFVHPDAASHFDMIARPN